MRQGSLPGDSVTVPRNEVLRLNPRGRFHLPPRPVKDRDWPSGGYKFFLQCRAASLGLASEGLSAQPAQPRGLSVRWVGGQTESPSRLGHGDSQEQRLSVHLGYPSWGPKSLSLGRVGAEVPGIDTYSLVEWFFF